MVQTIEQGDIFGRIGSQLGKGAGEQVERGMLARGLEKLAGNKDLSEIQRYAGLLRLPGGAEHASTLIPAMQRAAYFSEQKRRAESGAGSNEPLPGVPAAVATKTLKEQGMKPESVQKAMAPGRRGEGFAAPEEIQERKKSLLRVPSPSEIAREEVELGQRGISDPAETRRLAEEKLLGPGRAISANEVAFETKIGERINSLLGAEVQPGIRDAFREEGLHRIRQGKTPDEVVGEMVPMLHDIARAKTKLQETAGTWFKGPGAKFRAYEQQKETFDKFGLREQFLDLIKAEQGITAIQAAQDFDPLENKEIKKIIKALPKHAKGVLDMKENTLKSIVDNIHPSDNVLSIAGALRDANYSVPQFLSEAKTNPKLNPEQKRQLQNIETNSRLGDILWRAFK